MLVCPVGRAAETLVALLNSLGAEPSRDSAERRRPRGRYGLGYCEVIDLDLVRLRAPPEGSHKICPRPPVGGWRSHGRPHGEASQEWGRR